MSKVRLRDLEEWYDDPETELQNFMDSGQAIMSIMFPASRRPIELNKRDVGNLLIEIRKNKSWKCEYCLIGNLGIEEECVACGALRR
jgi:hypothetical protein